MMSVQSAWRRTRGRGLIYLYAQPFTDTTHDGVPVFETIAFLSTVAFAVIFVVLYQIDRSSRQSEERSAK